MCVDCVLALPKIAQVDPGVRPLPEVVLSRPSRIFASKVGSTSIVTLDSFTMLRLRYSISLHCSSCIFLAKVVLQYFLRLGASTTTLVFPGW
jgi:hypothetical protein